MPYYVGLDVSVKSVTICVGDGEGAVAARGEVSADLDQIAAFVLESGRSANLAFVLKDGLAKMGAIAQQVKKRPRG